MTEKFVIVSDAFKNEMLKLHMMDLRETKYIKLMATGKPSDVPITNSFTATFCMTGVYWDKIKE